MTWWLQLLIVFAGALLAAFLACLDAPIKLKIKEPLFAFRTKEWVILWSINCLIAFVVIYAASLLHKVDIGNVLGFLGVIFGYPLLLHTKLFTLRADSPENERSAGPQFLLDLAESIFLPGMQRSVGEKSTVVLEGYVSASGGARFEKLVEAAKNYLTGSKLQSAAETEQSIAYVDQLLADTVTRPKNGPANARALFYKIETIGGLRGATWVLRKAKV